MILNDLQYYTNLTCNFYNMNSKHYLKCKDCKKCENCKDDGVMV